MMKVLFVSWGEVPRLSSVYGGQLVNIAKAVGENPEVDSASLIAGMPLIHSGLVREKWRYRKQVKAISDLLGKEHFVRRFLLVPPVGIYPTKAQLPLFKFGQMGTMVSLLRNARPDILHCRSYLATYMAHEWRMASGLDYKIVFDSRSYMADEAIQRGRWTEGSADHLFWRQTEAQMLQQSDAVTVVSEPMRQRFIGMGAHPDKVHLIHLNVDPPKAVPSVNEVQSVEDRGPLFCYCGYLDYKTWHHPNNIWRIFNQIAKLRADARLLVITKSSHAMLKADLIAKGYEKLMDRIEFTSAETSSDCVRIMQNCDAGLLAYLTPQTPLEFEMAKGVFATKTAEYLYAGIPVLVSGVCGGAADFVTTHDVGIAYDAEDQLKLADIARLLTMKSETARLTGLANEKFNVKRNAERLVSIYNKVLA
ncbi:glycosyltransferase [Sphingorhabdus arenilitoris]|uniref:Glycosyltransferase n=1 Tax=Sphingorhabdus arenilitoris TaxID=1490041 RepID=A0ABV8RIZ1_9SPHN